MLRKFKWQAFIVLLGALACTAETWAQAPPAFNDLSGPGGKRLRETYSGSNSPATSKFRVPQNVQATPSSPSMYGGSRVGLGANSTIRGSKPFSSVQSQPTVSPYLNLFRTDLSTGGNFNYSTLVQPQLQQQQLNQQLERQALQTNRRLQAIAAQPDFNPAGSKDEYPTGHQTVFSYTGHYFPQAQVRQKRRAQ
jgi:hypothetical protein